MAKFLMKLSVKGSILTGAVYYTIDQGLWEDTDKADKVYAELYNAAAPYVKEVPVEMPDLPNTSQLCELSKFYYNRGVIATGSFIKDLPTLQADWFRSIKSSIGSLLESQSAEPAAPAK